MENFADIEQKFQEKLANITTQQELNNLKAEFLGKTGAVTLQTRKLSELPIEAKKEFGIKVNRLRDLITLQIAERQNHLDAAILEEKLHQEQIDITLPSYRIFEYGVQHPISKVIREIVGIFSLMGFVQVEGPEIEDDWHNFTALNISEIHPARQAHDTFYLENEELLLRTHTSSVEVRHMSMHKPPFKILSIGKAYRADHDATHTPMFHQVESLYVDKNVQLGHLKGCLTTFLKLFFGFGNSSSIRFRSSYFPFTEPSFEVDIKCDRSNHNELKVGTGDQWLEILGCGMTHPKVLQNSGIDPGEYRAFAFGMGIERLAMLKYNIPDLRKFFEGDIRWLRHYR